MVKLIIFIVLLDWFLAFAFRRRSNNLYVFPIIAAVAAAIPAAIQIINGIKQNKQAKELAKTKRPTYELPQGLQEAEQRTRNLPVYRRPPGRGYTEDLIQTSTAGGIENILESAGGSAEALAAISALTQGEQNQMRNLGASDELRVMQQEMGNEQALINLLSGQIAEGQNRQFDINKYQPYMQAMAAASALRGASQQNIYGGTSSLAQVASGTANYYAYKDLLKEMNQNNGTSYNIPTSSMSAAPTSTSPAMTGAPPNEYGNYYPEFDAYNYSQNWKYRK